MSPKYVYSSLLLFAAVGISGFSLEATAYAPSELATATQLFSKHCVACHGRDGRSQTSRGKANHARDLTDRKWQDDVSDERIYNSIMNGRDEQGTMPGFSDKLKENDANSLVKLVRGLRR